MTEGDGNYDNGMLCTWSLVCSNTAYVPQITFSTFNTEGGWDYVNIYDGVDATGNGLAQLHGDLTNNLPDPLNGNTDNVFVAFTSDGSVIRDGFTASFECVDPLDMPADCATEDLVLDWVGGMHASGHAVFDGVSQEHVSLATNSMMIAVADPLDGCMGTNVNMDGRATEVGSADWTGTFADGSMDGKIALIRRGACYFTSKTINAQNAGAAAVLIYNDHREGTVVMSGPDVGITIPSIFIEGTIGDQINDQVTADPTMMFSMHCGAQSFHMPNPCTDGRVYTDSGDVSMVGGYNNGHDCNWLLTCSDETLSPRVTFESFNTEGGWDFVNFYDGENTDATRIAQLHGNIDPDPVVGSGQIALLQFTSDGSVTRDGFIGTFDCTTSGAPPPPHPCVSGVTITDGGAIDFVMDDYENGMACQWSHVCNSGTPTVAFDTFQTEGNWDFVNIYDGASADDVRVGRCSGDSCEGQSGSGNTLLIEFTSDGSVVRDGFSATLACTDAVDPCLNTVVLSGDASFALDGGYDNGHDCNWVATCPSGTPTVSFDSFETEANWDFVYIYDGDNADADTLGTCHGTSCPGRFVGTSEAVLVRFTSDGSVTRQGFSASYTCTPTLEACGDPGSANSAEPGAGAVITDGMAIAYDQGTTDYTNCVWTIACPADTTAIVDFTGVNTEGNWDFLNVHADVSTVVNCIGPEGSNGGCDNSGDMGRYSGAVDDFSMSGVGAIQYISDWSVQSNPGGFTALLNCQGVADDCAVEDLVLDWEGGFHASGHAVFDDNAMVMDGVQSHQMVVADPLDGCMGTNVNMDGRPTEVGSADWTGTFADGSMDGKIALIRRGACYFTSKTINAQNAGATAVVIYNDDRAGTVNMSGPNVGITIPSIFIEGTFGDALNDAVTANPDLDVSMHCGTDSLHMPPADQIACSIGLTLDNADGGSFSKTGGYDNGHDCNWLLVCPDGWAPAVTFSSFQTEGGWDFVAIYDGDNAGAAQLANCNGNSCDDQVASQANMLVRFTSDGSVTMDGFEASYVCGDPAGADENACGPRGSENQASPGNYNIADGETVTYEQGATDYTNCRWTTTCGANQVASVEFSNVISEGNWDFLNVWSGPDVVNCIGPAGSNGGCDNTGDLGRYSGETPQAFTTEGVGSFQYISDWSVQAGGSGFTATLTCVTPPDPCSGDPVAVTGDFGNSGGYTNNLDCFWVGTCAEGRPTVEFTTFQTEGNWDFVNIYPGTATSGATLQRCHGNACPMTQGDAGGSITVHFESDGSVVQDGFSATFSCDMTPQYNPYDCTYTKSTDQKNMQDAETACTVLGGHLASIHTPSQQAAIGALDANGAWIGFHDRHSEAGCTGQSNGVGQAGGFIWTDGSPTDFLAWGGGEPNDWQDGAAHCDGTSTIGEDCTHVRGDNLWNDAGCGGSRNYICQDCGDVPGPTSFSKIDGAGGMWDAEALCANNGGHLASVHSDDDKAAIAALGANGAWIGFHDTYAEAGCTGQSNDVNEEGGFVWTDGTATNYLSWGGGEPNDWQDGAAHCDGTSTVGEDCSHVRGDNNWNDAGCGGNRAAICGFNGDWIPTACNGGTTLFGSGTFQKNQGYDDGHDCNWLLMCPEGESPTVAFSEFQLEANWDFVTLYDGDTAAAAQVARCSGGSCDGGSGSAQNMLVRMTSDGSVTQDGFVGSFSCTPSAMCNGEDMMVDWTGGFHASGHSVFDGYDNNHNAALTADAQVVVADPLDGCMGTNVDMDGRATEVGSADWTGNFADGSMTGKIALIRRGACYFTSKTINAQNAGAVGVIVYNDHRAGTVNMSGPNVGITIPSIFIEGTDGDTLNDAVTADPTIVVSMHCDERYIYQICANEDLVVDWTGGFHASGHAVFDGYSGVHDATLTANAQVVVADPLDGCMGTNVDMDGRATEVGSADWTGNFADGSMDGKIALIRRGACYFTSKTINAQNAGAIGVIVYNDHRDGTVNMSGPDVGITIPSIFILGTDGDAMNAAVTADPTITADIHCDEDARNVVSNPCGPSGDAGGNTATAGGMVVGCGDTFGIDVEPDHQQNCVWTMESAGSVAFTGFVSEGNWDFLNVWSDAALVADCYGPSGSNGGCDNTGDLGRFSGTQDPGTIENVAAVQLITDWSYMEPGTGFSATLTC
jgi:hypothetical protein